jgi:hypothetical protein
MVIRCFFGLKKNCVSRKYRIFLGGLPVFFGSCTNKTKNNELTISTAKKNTSERMKRLLEINYAQLSQKHNMELFIDSNQLFMFVLFWSSGFSKNKTPLVSAGKAAHTHTHTHTHTHSPTHTRRHTLVYRHTYIHRRSSPYRD